MPLMLAFLQARESWRAMSNHLLNLTLGPILLCFGYIILSPILFVCGFFVGVFLVDSLLTQHSIMIDESQQWISSLLVIASGLIAGWIALRLVSFGMFSVGSSVGYFMFTTFTPHLTMADKPNAPFSVYGLIFAFFLGSLTVCLQKPLLVTATSFVGACAIVYSLSFYLVHIDNPFMSIIPVSPSLQNGTSLSPTFEVDWTTLLHDKKRIIILMSLVVLTIFGVHTQYVLSQNRTVQRYIAHDSSRAPRPGYIPVTDDLRAIA